MPLNQLIPLPPHARQRQDQLAFRWRERNCFATFNAGDIFGEIAVLDGEERSADATAMTECELLVLNRRDFLPVLEGHADLCMILLRTLCRRLRQTTEQVEDVMFLDLESRVAKGLLQLVAPVGLRALHSPSVELHVSQRELGNWRPAAGRA